jgi:hypothetical protein
MIGLKIIDMPELAGHWQIYEKLDSASTGTPFDEEQPRSSSDADQRARELATQYPGRTFGVALLTDQADRAGHGMVEYRLEAGALRQFTYEAVHKLSAE